MSKKYKVINIATHTEAPKSSVLLIYTGGTFGMVFDEDGSLKPFNFSLVLDKIPELQMLDLRLTVISFPEPVDSSNVSVEHWQAMAHIVKDHYYQFDAFVILHGTDTMAYTASALSFMLKGLNKPVILTGAQIPIGATRSDARENLITALEIASKKNGSGPMLNEVALYFNYYLLKGNRSQKIRSSNFAAFESENFPYLAESGVEIVFNESFLRAYDPHSKLEYYPDMDSNVVILKLFPGISKEVVKSILEIKGLKGVVIESYGSGNVMTWRWFTRLLKEAVSRGIILYNVSQCMGGSVVQGRYETSKMLSEIGVVSGHDITTEAALAKLMHLLGNEKDSEVIKEKLKMPLRGELTAQD
ncbi:asparaginase [Reichenbachiella agarivorans]|uniref:asparaginase n=1 Tax=Reichenbachiella agarivorans TaxID=2979464 RepID=A0ABY6CRD3_9BACT|nr:asparaginase [Reichenbachiella agarivorans]UXP30855.1 asparaginase [Reichenbachiella agarivorans]